DLAAPRLQGDVTALRQIEVVATTARRAHHLATVCDGAMLRKAEDVFAEVPATALVGMATEIGSVRKHLMRHLRHAELSRAATQLAAMTAKLASASGPIAESLRRFMADELGRTDTAADQTAAR